MNTAPLTCAELVELVTEYLDGTMPPALRERFDDHLALDTRRNLTITYPDGAIQTTGPPTIRAG